MLGSVMFQRMAFFVMVGDTRKFHSIPMPSSLRPGIGGIKY